MADRAGIEIDYCPMCRGVWLDRGELDKIIERSAAAAPEPPAQQQPMQQQPMQQQPMQQQPMQQQPMQQQPMQQQPMQSNSKYHGKYHSKYHDPRGGTYPRRKKSYLGELFDF